MQVSVENWVRSPAVLVSGRWRLFGEIFHLFRSVHAFIKSFLNIFRERLYGVIHNN
jgi:hypothetical protein